MIVAVAVVIFDATAANDTVGFPVFSVLPIKTLEFVHSLFRLFRKMYASRHRCVIHIRLRLSKSNREKNERTHTPMYEKKKKKQTNKTTTLESFSIVCLHARSTIMT